MNLIIILLILNLSACGENETQNIKHEKSTKNSKGSGLSIEPFVQGLEVPWSIVFTSADRILVIERPGRLRIIENGKLTVEPLKNFPEVSSGSEEGLMGLALDPDYTTNKLIYISYAYEKGGDLFVKVIRCKDNGSNLAEETVIFDGIPAAQYHAGCRLRFGPDGKLYITTGDAGERKYAQDLDKLHGKILRINPDGSIPADNPFPGSPVWSYGHRNPQGIDWYPGTSIMWSTEHGPSGFDGPGGGDEVNVIVKGKNYGWPEVSHTDSKGGMVSPLLVFTPAEAPASGMFYKSGKIAEFKNCFLFGCLRGNGIMVVKVDENDPTKQVSFRKIADTYGRIRDIAEGPDGNIYFSSSNRDGRGKVQSGDDKIYRITAK
ncbi:MAG: PQQ-dependent sugar dehydrogenase [Ignavibacteria bacterium]|nr:PQQ-dependent sugar dehydrogenase [Ignavibacteria bacterium]